MRIGRVGRRWLKRLALVVGFWMIGVSTLEAQGRVRVRGYFRSDGTYVRPHYRTAPDGIPYNNYSFPGNYNPNTGRITDGDPADYLERYYRSRGGLGIRSGVTSWAMSDTDIASLPALPDEVVREEFDRARIYCGYIYPVGSSGRTSCEMRQVMALSAVVLPDYSTLPRDDAGRSARYCEFVYGDNRAGFYNCLNRQLFGLEGIGAEFELDDDQDERRARSYCEFVYGDNRAGFTSCLARQARGLRGSMPEGDGIPGEEWRRATRYCEFVYGDNRAGYQDCLERQDRGLRRSDPRWEGISSTERQRAERYCEFVYGDNRASNLDCRRRQASGLVRFFSDGRAIRLPAADRARYCEGIYGDNRASYWACTSR